MFETSGNELRLPHFPAFFNPDLFYPFLVYCLAFQLLGVCIHRHCWTGSEHRKKLFRLQNTTVCLIHSLISGLGALLFAITHSRLMLDDYAVMHWYEEWSRHLPLLSLGYFAYDTVDMLRHELSRWTLEYVLHHFASFFFLLCILLPRKFILYAYWGLLMEVSSIFLHVRTILHLSGRSSRDSRLYRVVCHVNASAFVVFRFLVQAWQLWWIWRQRPHVHPFYYSVGVYGGVLFLLINVCLFMRLLAADFPGMLGWIRSRASTIFACRREVVKNGQVAHTENGVHKAR